MVRIANAHGRFQAEDSGNFADVLPVAVRALVHADNDGAKAARRAGSFAPDRGRFELIIGGATQDFADPAKIEGIIALEALLAVKEAAGECAPGEKIKTILPRAAKELGLLHEKGGLRRVRAAWEGSAGCWKAATFINFLHRRDAMRDKRKLKARSELAALCLTLDAINARGRKTKDAAATSGVIGIDADQVRRLLREAGIGDSAVPQTKRR